MRGGSTDLPGDCMNLLATLEKKIYTKIRTMCSPRLSSADNAGGKPSKNIVLASCLFLFFSRVVNGVHADFDGLVVVEHFRPAGLKIPLMWGK